MKHRKSEHWNSIKKCKNNEGCLFKNECWYKHEEINDNDYENDDKKENIIQKLFEVVDKFTEKVTKLENINLQNNKWKASSNWNKIINIHKKLKSEHWNEKWRSKLKSEN